MHKLLLLALLSYAVSSISMELLELPSHSLIKIPDEIKKETSRYVPLPQWWYLQHTLEHNDSVWRAIIDSRKKIFATSAGRKVYIFDIKTKSCIADFLHIYFVCEIKLSQCGTLLATACYDDGRISLFDIQAKMEITSFQCYNYESICFNSQESLQVDRYNETYIFNKKDNTWITVPRKYSNHSKDFKGGPHLDCNMVYLLNNKKEKIASFRHDYPVCCVEADHPANILITACRDGKARIFALHNNDTLDQRMLKTALNTWLLIEKPSKELIDRDMILSDVALKCFDPYLHITKDTLINICHTFPKDMQDALWRTTHYKIQKYGKSTSSYCSIQ